MAFQIKCYDSPSSEQIEFIRSSLENDSKERSDNYQSEFQKFIFYVYENKQVIGGCYCALYFGSLHIYLMWIKQEYRKLGYGKKLIEKIELLAKKKNCLFITLNTIMNKDADDFYKNLGFKREYTRKGYKNDAYSCYYRKDLQLVKSPMQER